jgi:hypothetical protein
VIVAPLKFNNAGAVTVAVASTVNRLSAGTHTVLPDVCAAWAVSM